MIADGVAPLWIADWMKANEATRYSTRVGVYATLNTGIMFSEPGGSPWSAILKTRNRFEMSSSDAGASSKPKQGKNVIGDYSIGKKLGKGCLVVTPRMPSSVTPEVLCQRPRYWIIW